MEAGQDRDVARSEPKSPTHPTLRSYGVLTRERCSSVRRAAHGGGRASTSLFGAASPLEASGTCATTFRSRSIARRTSNEGRFDPAVRLWVSSPGPCLRDRGRHHSPTTRSFPPRTSTAVNAGSTATRACRTVFPSTTSTRLPQQLSTSCCGRPSTGSTPGRHGPGPTRPRPSAPAPRRPAAAAHRRRVSAGGADDNG
jgi:hypothetical protein